MANHHIICVTVICFVVVSFVESTAPPTYGASPYTYDKTINPSTGYSATQRPGAFWSLDSTTLEYLGIDESANSRTNPPKGIPYNNSATKGSFVINTDGLDAHPERTGQDTTDKSIMTSGVEGSCVAISDFTANEDLCLSDPSLCDLENGNQKRGLSMSMWINLPHTFNTDWRYILDTGGSVTGKTGVSIRMRGSRDGRRFSHEIEFIVSTGTKYWRAVLNGMTNAYEWNNIAFRWSEEIETSVGVPYGLQVFVNGSATAWKRSPYNSGATGKVTATLPNLKITVGCDHMGKHPQQGIFANLAFWYWRLEDAETDSKPLFSSSAAIRKETEYFLGGVTFSGDSVLADPNVGDTDGPALCTTKCTNSGSSADDDNPWQYDYEMNGGDLDKWDSFYLEDTSLAQEGDCDPQNPNTWGHGFFNNPPHPVDCADTMKELKLALDHDDNYEPLNLIRALVRVVTRTEVGVSAEDVDYLFGTAATKAYSKMIAKDTNDFKVYSTAETYANIVFLVSRLSNHELYGDRWGSVATKYGPTFWMKFLDSWLRYIATHIEHKVAIQREANQTVVNVIRAKASQINAGVFFPDYAATVTADNGEKESLYRFPEVRKDSWGWVKDYITLPVGYFNTYNDSSNIQVVAKIYNQFHKALPVTIDPRVKGVSEVTWTLNSRIMSLSVDSDEQTNGSFLTVYPVEFFVEHRERQSEHPVKKGAILCVHWHYNDNSSEAIGAWDTSGCTLKMTNDTHSLCQCTHMTDYAILTEDREAPGEVGDGGYYFCYALYAISMILLFVFLIIVVANIRLHYELHIINMNIAVAMFFAILFYVSSLSAYEQRMGCIIVSVLMHYCYTACYVWCVCLSHYLFRAITSGKMGNILKYYCWVGWGLPALICLIMTAVDVTRYGIGERCLGDQEGYFLWVYIGTFIFFCLLVCPLFVIAIINLNKNMVKDPEDHQDVKFTLFGIMAFWPFILLVWLMAMLTYLVPQDTMIVDFLFEFLNSLQGILIFLLLGVLVPAFRGCLFCCCHREQPAPPDDLLYRLSETEEDIIASTPKPVSSAEVSESAATAADEPPAEEDEKERKKREKEEKKQEKERKKREKEEEKKKKEEEEANKQKEEDKPKKKKKNKSNNYAGSDMFGGGK